MQEPDVVICPHCAARITIFDEEMRSWDRCVKCGKSMSYSINQESLDNHTENEAARAEKIQERIRELENKISEAEKGYSQVNGEVLEDHQGQESEQYELNSRPTEASGGSSVEPIGYKPIRDARDAVGLFLVVALSLFLIGFLVYACHESEKEHRQSELLRKKEQHPYDIAATKGQEPYVIAMTSEDSTKVRKAIKAVYDEFADFADRYPLAPQQVIEAGDIKHAELEEIEMRCRTVVNDLKYINASDDLVQEWVLCLVDSLFYQAKVSQTQMNMAQTDEVLRRIKAKIKAKQQYKKFR